MTVSDPVLSAIVASNTQLFSTGRISTELTRPSIVALRAFSSATMVVTPLAVPFAVRWVPRVPWG